MHETHAGDRRRYERVPLVRRGKFRVPGWVRFAPCHTTNISHTGVLLCLSTEHPLVAGDEVELAIAFNDESLLPSEATTRAVVRRVTTINHSTQAVGLEFREEGALPFMPIVTRPAQPSEPQRAAA